MKSPVLEWVGKIHNSLCGILRHDLRPEDVAELTGTEAVKLVENLAQVEHAAATAKMVVARRAADTPAWKVDGDKSAAHWLARVTGITVFDARRLLDTADRLARLPETDKAARSGELSPEQLAEITAGADADPTAEESLLDTARRETVADLKDKSKKAQAAATDHAGRHRAIRRRRRLRHGTNADGEFWLTFNHTADVGAQVLAALRPIQDRIFARARDRGERESTEAYAADALVEALTTEHAAGDEPAAGTDTATGSRRYPPRPRRPRPSRDIKVIVRIDHPALVRGYAEPGETCDIVGVGPVPVESVKKMMDDAFLAAIVTDGVDVRAVAHLGRHTTAHQQTALDFSQPACEVLGCPFSAFVQIDHRDDWATTHITQLDTLDKLCTDHHQMKTHHRWRLEPGRGKRRFLSPDQHNDGANRGHDPPGGDAA